MNAVRSTGCMGLHSSSRVGALRVVFERLFKSKALVMMERLHFSVALYRAAYFVLVTVLPAMSESKAQDSFGYALAVNADGVILTLDAEMNDSAVSDQAAEVVPRIPSWNRMYTYSAMPRAVLNQLIIARGMVFYCAIRNRTGSAWVYLERNVMSTEYSVWRFDLVNGDRTLLFSEENSPDVSHQFRPIGWSAM